MARRALRKIDPTLDLSRHYCDAADLPSVFDSTALFDLRQPLEVEVGTGKGLFLTSAALAQAEHNFLGIEIARKYARFAAARLAKHDLSNACVICGDALCYSANGFQPLRWPPFTYIFQTLGGKSGTKSVGS